MAQITKEQFVAEIKQKYPAYKDVNDDVLYTKMIEKYPVYKDRITEKKNYIGDKPGIDDPKLRKAVGHTITGLQIAAPVAAGFFSGGTAAVPVSVASAGIGEYARALTEGKGQLEGLKRGAIGAGTDFAFGKVGGMIGKGATSLVKGKLSAQLGEEATEKIIKNIPKYTKKAKDTYKDVTKLGKESLEELVKKTGKEVGDAKMIARQSKKIVDTTPLKKEVKEMLLKEDIRSLKDLGDFASPTQLRKTIKRIEKLPSKANISDLMRTVDRSYDNLTPIYNKKIANQSLTTAEGLAERITGKLNKLASTSASDILPASKKKYATVMKLMNDENASIKRALSSQESFNSLLNNTIKDKKWKTLENLIKLDDLLPAKQKFLDKHLTRISGDTLRNLKSLYLSEAGLRTTGFTILPRVAAKGLRGASTETGKAGMQLTKTGLRRLAELGITGY
ncbi:MAG TPA: hypothetical protein PLZ69_00940 [Candidatus Pacearchaeota archaeon]|nr:hypothetical protein [Candidatus Pacearchaeota archaeon]